jgi:hypothetical protein
MESINVTVASWATLQEAGFDPSTALDALALNAILLCPLLYRFLNTEPAVAASTHIYALGGPL